jgi:hypothetical protein
VRLAFTFIGIALAVWLVVAIVVCDGTIPYCVGYSLKALILDIWEGVTQ